MDAGKKRKNLEAAEGQLDLLVELIQKHPHVQSEKNSATGQGRVRSEKIWGNMAVSLNEHGVQKSWEQWKDTWNNLKVKTRKKLAKSQRSGSAGSSVRGKSPEIMSLSEREKKVLTIVGTSSDEEIRTQEQMAAESSTNQIFTGDLVLISVSDKQGISTFGRDLHTLGLKLVASGGTALTLREAGIPFKEFTDLTGAPETLGGRLKTLHPAVHSGILARPSSNELKELTSNNYELVKMVVCNLQPFPRATNKKNASSQDIMESADIGVITMIRAAAKNHSRVTVIVDPNDYELVTRELDFGKDTTLETRQRLALKAFAYTSEYDACIADYLRKEFSHNISQITLAHGINPHQRPAQIFTNASQLPIKVICGTPGFVKLCDALNAWQFVKEMRRAIGLPAATSFKHLSPAGAAVGVPLDQFGAKVCQVSDMVDMLSPLASAYARARGADRMSSYGDFVALSDVCDLPTAKIISREISDGIIAPGYSSEALEVLRKKKNGSYCIVEIDSDYVPNDMERRTVFGLIFEQQRNNAIIDKSIFTNSVTNNVGFSESTIRDLIIATLAVKYTQSSSICYAKDGQIIGIGAGQQSRLHCTRLAGDKADNWWLRHHPRIFGMKFRKGVKRTEMSNAVDSFVNGTVGKDISYDHWSSYFDEVPPPLTDCDRKEWAKMLSGVALASDGAFPIRDNIDRAHLSGVEYISAPGSTNDEVIKHACQEHGIAWMRTNLRLFHH